jgi:hypothetical protein
MTAKEELHRVVDELSDESARTALAYVRALLEYLRLSGEQVAGDPLTWRMGSLLVPGRDFFAEATAESSVLAVQQGVEPVASLDDLAGDFWPEDESVDDFVEAVRRWRREDGSA